MYELQTAVWMEALRDVPRRPGSRPVLFSGGRPLPASCYMLAGLGPGHIAAGFFDYHRNRPHSGTVVKDTVAECGRFLPWHRESIICPKRQIRLSILRQAASASGSKSSSRCAPLGAGEETSRAISLEFAWKRNLLSLKTLSEGVLEFWISL